MNLQRRTPGWPWLGVALSIAMCLALLATDGQASPLKVEIVEADGKFALLRDDKPYRINGAGIEVGDLESFAAHGGTSFRTWTTANGQEVLDRAHALGLTVSMCLPMVHERHGLDYDDPLAVAEQYERLKAEVLKYKDHPALLTWIVGNELNHDFNNPRVYDAVNQLSELIHAVDPNHPTTTTLAGFSAELIDFLKIRAPDLDFLSFQLYGELFALPDYLASSGFDRPYFVTEWGAIGYWEVAKTSWGAPIEQDSSAKARTYLKGYRQAIAPFTNQTLGNYVFLWGQKQERTPTWFGLLTESGEVTEAVDVLHYLWTGSWPDNRTPRVESLLLDGRNYRQSVVLTTGESYGAVFEVVDHDGDPLTYHWEVKPESESQKSGGDREERLPNLEEFLVSANGPTANIRAVAPGRYRLFAYTFDDNGHAAHANIPFLVRETSEP